MSVGPYMQGRARLRASTGGRPAMQTGVAFPLLCPHPVHARSDACQGGGWNSCACLKARAKVEGMAC